MEKEIKKDPYAELGVSSKKEAVHEATKNLSKGLYPGAFCQVIPVPKTLPKDIQDNYAQVIHSDGVGTKSNVAYMAVKEGYDKDILRSLAQDAIVMNTDDMLCVGVTDGIGISNHIARNANRVDDEALSKIVQGYSDIFKKMQTNGIDIYNAGGETADVGSYTTTVGIDVTASAIIPKDKIIDCSNIKPGQYIVGLSSSGMCMGEEKENSGIRSNGLTLAINTLLCPYYRKYTEAMDGTIDPNKLFRGKYHLDDKLEGTDLTIAEALLSPTRTYLPFMKKVFMLEDEINISGIIHCSGGGLTKSINFGNDIAYIKDNVSQIATPAIFREIQESANIDDYNMYQTFNMGVGIEVVVDSLEGAKRLQELASWYNLRSAIIGRTEYCEDGNRVEIGQGPNKLIYKK